MERRLRRHKFPFIGAVVAALVSVPSGAAQPPSEDKSPSGECGQAAQVLGDLLKRGLADSEAETLGRKAVELCPQMAEAHFNLGVVLAAKEKWDDAISAFDKAIAAQDNPNFRVARATTLAQSGKLDDAAAEYRRTLERSPKHVQALQGLAVVLERQNKPAEAIDRLLEAKEADATQPLTWFNLGVLYERNGEVDSAIDAYRRTVQLDPKYFQAHVALGNLLSSRKEFEASEAALKKASEINPSDPEVVKALGNLYRDGGELEKAELMYRQAARISEKDVEAWLGLAEVQLTLKRAERAEESAEKAVEIAPDDPRAIRLLGWAELELGKVEKAERNFKNALAANPGDAKSHRAVADLYRRTGRAELAAQHEQSAEQLEKVE